MKRVGIITLYGLNNYGNRLQNYAAQKIFTDMGYDTKTYGTEVYYYGRFTRKYRIKQLVHEVTKYKFTSNQSSWAKSNREMLFEDFTKKFLPTEKVEDITTLSEKADFFVVGSDQVWNPLWYYNHDKELFLLTFAKPEQKVCLSPSFGISELPDNWKPWFKDNLSSFPSINIREQSGANIIKQLTNRDTEVMIDPTLMIDAEDWMKIAKRPYGINTRDPFILTYFLGNRTEQTEEDIAEILKTREMNVFHLLDESTPFVYECGPSEFVYLFSKADLILTDSFHACIFSFLFGKPFMVYGRVQEECCDMNSRLDTLLTILKIERKYRNNNLKTNWFECNYEEGWNSLIIEREKLRAYLMRRLDPNFKG